MTRHDAEVITINEAARRLGISRSLAYKLVREGTFPAPVIKLGRAVRIPRRGFEQMLYDRRNPLPLESL